MCIKFEAVTSSFEQITLKRHLDVGNQRLMHFQLYYRCEDWILSSKILLISELLDLNH